MGDLHKKFGTAPVRNAYFEVIDDACQIMRENEDRIIRDLILSSSSQVEVNDDIEDFEGIALEITDDEIKVSKGSKEFVLFHFFGVQ